jgi:peptide/nickel transport system permease protein
VPSPVTFILKRLAAGCVLLFAVCAAAFLVLNAAARNPARQILGVQATASQVAKERQQLGLNQPLVVQFWHWFGGAVHGNLGASWYSGTPVSQLLVSRVPVTLTLVIGATLIAGILGVSLGTLAALRGGWVDTAIQVVGTAGIAVPGFLVVLAFIDIFALDLHWFEPTGFVAFNSSPGQWLQSITLPILALAVVATAGIVPQVRGAVSDSLRQDWVRTLRSRGLNERSVIFRHVLRNSMGPCLSVVGVTFVALLSGVVIVEQLFAIPGIGQEAISATIQGDVPVVMGTIAVIAIIVVVVNLLVDLLQALLNPKVRLA